MNREYIRYIGYLIDIAQINDSFYLTSRAFNEFSAEVLKALEKQMPRKVDMEITEIGVVQHICQSCWGFVGYLHEHCENCGQKLDWED